MNHAGDAYQRLSALLLDYVRPLGMLKEEGPLRAMRELTAGIVFTGSVQLSNAARLFAHGPGELRDAVKRLSLRLADKHWDHHEWASQVLELQARELEDLSLIPIDATELAKPYARKMEYQCTVKDASRPGDPLVNGYCCWGAYHWDAERSDLRPLMLRPYSWSMPRFRSENDQWREYLWALRQATGGKGIWVHDRGGDRPEILSAFLHIQPRWIIRLREDRPLVGPDGTTRPAGVWADWALANRNERGKAVTLEVSLPRKGLWQVEHPPKLHLVVPTYTFGPAHDPDRWVLLTCGLISDHRGPRQTRHDYGLRWRSEDAKRFLGQVWHVERFLVRSFLAIERLLWCVTLAGGFLSTLRREEPELSEQLESEVLYWDKGDKYRPKVPCYRTARGVQAVALRQACLPTSTTRVSATTRVLARMPVLNNA